MTMFGTRIGEAFAGDGVDAAHVNIVIGDKSALGAVFAQALASPRPGHAPSVTVLRPNMPVKPLTLFVNKATIASEQHGNLTWGAAQAGVAVGITDAIANGVIPEGLADDIVAVAAVWVNPEATDAAAVFRNNAMSTAGAVAAAVRGEPRARDVVAARADCHNPFFDARPVLSATSNPGDR